MAFHKGSKDRGYSEFSFYPPFRESITDHSVVSPIKLRRTKAKFIYGAHIDIPCYDVDPDPNTIRGLPGRLVDVPTVVVPQGLDDEGPFAEIVVPENFPPGSFMLFQTALQGIEPELEAFCSEGVEEAFRSLNLVDLNVILYRADGEERDATDGEFGAYLVPGMGGMVYCGLQGWMHPLKHIMRYNDLGHPLCAHLRDGTWALDYIPNRLKKSVSCIVFMGGAS